MIITIIISSCGFAHHRARVQYPVGTVLSTELPTDYHHNSIKLSVRW